MIDISETKDSALIAELAWQGKVPDSYRENNPLWVYDVDPIEVVPNVWFLMSFANVTAILCHDIFSNYWVLVDCGFTFTVSEIYNKIQSLHKVPIHTVIITHGHIDHCGGSMELEKYNVNDYGSKIRFVGHVNIHKRFDRYVKTSHYNYLLNEKQFDSSFDVQYNEIKRMDITYYDKLTLTIGEHILQLFHDKGETDDHTWVYLQKENIIITGDFVIWNLCNCGNPQKVARYPQEWANTMKKMEALNVNILLTGHGPYIKGRDRVQQVLNDTYTVLDTVISQTIDLINQGLPRHEIVLGVKMPTDLLNKPYLKPFYADPQFIVQDVIRGNCGWWSGELYKLKELDMKKVGSDMVDSFGDMRRFCQYIQNHIDKDNMDLALFYLEMGLYAYPNDKTLLPLAEVIYSHYSDFNISPASMVRNQFRYRLKQISSKL